MNHCSTCGILRLPNDNHPTSGACLNDQRFWRLSFAYVDRSGALHAYRVSRADENKWAVVRLSTDSIYPLNLGREIEREYDEVNTRFWQEDHGTPVIPQRVDGQGQLVYIPPKIELFGQVVTMPEEDFKNVLRTGFWPVWAVRQQSKYDILFRVSDSVLDRITKAQDRLAWLPCSTPPMSLRLVYGCHLLREQAGEMPMPVRPKRNKEDDPPVVGLSHVQSGREMTNKVVVVGREY